MWVENQKSHFPPPFFFKVHETRGRYISEITSMDFSTQKWEPASVKHMASCRNPSRNKTHILQRECLTSGRGFPEDGLTFTWNLNMKSGNLSKRKIYAKLNWSDQLKTDWSMAISTVCDSQEIKLNDLKHPLAFKVCMTLWSQERTVLKKCFETCLISSIISAEDIM